MAVTWRMLVWDSAGNAKDTVTPDSAIDELTSFSVDGAGNCLEASFTGVGAHLDVRPRDIIQLQIDPDGFGWQSVWKGFVVQAAASRSTEIRSYRAVGLKQRLYERHIERWFVPDTAPDDAAKLAEALFDSETNGYPQSWTFPAGFTAQDVSDLVFPALGFSLGFRYPNLETAGDALDSIAETVGRFIVPVGESYTYDGKTYNEHDIVPRVHSGVDAEGNLFFRRPQAAPVVVVEGTGGVHVAWRDVNAESVVDHVTVVFASELAEGWRPGPDDADGEPQPMWRQYGAVDANGDPNGALDAEKRVVLEAPIDYMERTIGEDIFQDMGSFSNKGNIYDGDPSTHATVTTTSGATLISRHVLDEISCIMRLRVKCAAGRVLKMGGVDLNMVHVYGYYRLDATADVLDLYLPILPAMHDMGEGTDMVLIAQGFGEDDEIYLFEFYVPDDDAASQLAEAYMKDVGEEPAEIRLSGRLGAVSQTMSLTPIGESARSVDIERIDYHLSNSQGLVTTYHLQQLDDTELMSQKVVLDRLASARGRDEASGLMKVRGAAKGRR